MPAFERKLLCFVEKHKEVIFAAVLFVAGLIMRYPLRSLYVPAPGGGMFRWASDAACAVSAGYLASKLAGKKERGFITAGLSWCSMAGVFGSVIYGRYESLCLCFIFMSVLALHREKESAACLLLTAASAISPYALLILPCIIIRAVREEKTMLTVLPPAAVTALRCALPGREAYIPAGFTEKSLYSLNPSFWTIFPENAKETVFEQYLPAAFALALTISVIIIAHYARKKNRKTENRYLILFIPALAAAFLFPGLDEGAFIVCGGLMLVSLVFSLKLLIPFMLVEAVRLYLLSPALYGEELRFVPIQGMSLIICGILIFLIFYEKQLDRKDKV